MRRVWKESFWEFESRCVCVCVCVCVCCRVPEGLLRLIHVSYCTGLWYKKSRNVTLSATKICQYRSKTSPSRSWTVCHEGCYSLLTVQHAEGYVPCRLYQFRELYEHTQARNLFQPTDARWPHIIVVISTDSQPLLQLNFVYWAVLCYVGCMTCLCCVMLATWFVCVFVLFCNLPLPS